MSALASNLERDFPTRGSRPPRRFDLRRTSDIRMHETVDHIAVENEVAAAHFWPNADAVGQNVFTIDRGGVRKAMRVVGVVGSTFARRSPERRQPFFYRPFVQDYAAAGGIVVRAQDPSSTVDALRQAVRALNPELAIVGLKTLATHVADQVWPARLAAITSGMFGILALGLSTLGLYAVMAYVAARRTREVGLRMALALMTGRLLSAFLFGIPAVDPFTFTAVPILFAAMNFVACYVPAGRAARIDPMIALRHL
jgi:putative ABC transport system permease protein